MLRYFAHVPGELVYRGAERKDVATLQRPSIGCGLVQQLKRHVPVSTKITCWVQIYKRLVCNTPCVTLIDTQGARFRANSAAEVRELELQLLLSSRLSRIQNPEQNIMGLYVQMCDRHFFIVQFYQASEALTQNGAEEFLRKESAVCGYN